MTSSELISGFTQYFPQIFGCFDYMVEGGSDGGKRLVGNAIHIRLLDKYPRL